MKYYKLSMDMERTNDIIAHYTDDFGMEDNDLIIGEKYKGWNENFHFVFDKNEGDIASDFLANDKGWFVVSEKLKNILGNMNTEIQYFTVDVIEKATGKKYKYNVANIVKLVDALCLEHSDYFETDIPGIGIIYTVSKYAIYQKKVNGADVFKLTNNQEIPIFVSEHFKNEVEKNNITGMGFYEIRVY